jgi:lysophospholipase L1-like esterase
MIKIFKNITIYIFIISCLFFILEIFSRAIFPEFTSNFIETEIKNNHKISLGKNIYIKKINNINFRVASQNNLEQIDNKKNIWIFGDSVTFGMGNKYTNTFYFYLKKNLELENLQYNILISGDYGADSESTYNKIKLLEKKFLPEDIIIYQFNYNDITKQNEKILKDDNYLIKFIFKTAQFRYEYLNKSTFISTLSHYAGIFARKTNGDCDSRGLDALGQYTYAYIGKNYIETSNNAWKTFENNIEKISNLAKKNNLKFLILISPIPLQIPHHEDNNKLKFDISCATIDPHEKLISILKNKKYLYSDPLNLFITSSKINKRENNNGLLFLKYDDNHPNADGNKLLSISLFHEVKKIILNSYN